MSDMPNLFRLGREEWLTEARLTAKKLLRRRMTITIEDVLELCPKPSFLHRNTIGHVFRDDDFIAVGYCLARKPSSHGRVIRRWALKNPIEIRRVRRKEYENE